jgi:uncharacterized protein YjeT (DUF2065 family)
MDIAWKDLWTAIALMLIIEGITPFINPSTFRQVIQLLSQMDEKKIRMMGAFWMGLGLLVLYWVRS